MEKAEKENSEIDFTEFEPGKYGNKYFPVMVDTFYGWIELEVHCAYRQNSG